MKIALISPYEDLIAYGLRTLCACLKNNGHAVTLVFLQGPFGCAYADEALDELAELIKGSNLIGVSLMTDHFQKAVQITRRLKQSTAAPIIWGGVHPTLSPEECLSYADIVCVGEGELALVELAGKMATGEDYSAIQNIWLKGSGALITNSPRPLVKDLDSLPFPDYD
jgi:radical SAM superfamily enzyme YgiQ (UPF0313 family)